MRPPEAVACAVDPRYLCVEGTCIHFPKLLQIARTLNDALNEAEGILIDNTEAAGLAAATAIQEADEALGTIDFTDCRPVRPGCN